MLIWWNQWDHPRIPGFGGGTFSIFFFQEMSSLLFCWNNFAEKFLHYLVVIVLYQPPFPNTCLLTALFGWKYLALDVIGNMSSCIALIRIFYQYSRNTKKYFYKGILVISWLKGELPWYLCFGQSCQSIWKRRLVFVDFQIWVLTNARTAFALCHPSRKHGVGTCGSCIRVL
jgi:hypothetical protein